MATIKDVAKRAGVSVGSVSNFINNIEVKPKTRLAIEKAIEELNYEPNMYARGFKKNKTNTVALIIPSVWHPFFGEVTYNIEKSLRKYDMKMILCNTEDDYEIELNYIAMAKQNKVDGIIAMTYSDVDKYISANLPLISIDRYFSEDITHVTSDNFKGGRIAAEELVKAGCKNLAFIGSGSSIDNSTRKRRKGFESYCEENRITYKICDNLDINKDFNCVLDDFINSNFKQEKKVDGIFTITDDHAIDVIDRLKAINIDVPNDVQIIGYDGRRTSRDDVIKISTIKQQVELIAKAAVEALMELIDKKERKKEKRKEILIPVKFIKGYTTK